MCIRDRPYPSAEVSGREVCRLFFLRRLYLFGSPNSLLYRSDLVRSRNPFYDERLAPFEDGQVCFDLLKSNNFGFVHQVLTFSRRDNESISNRIRPYNYLALFRLQAVVLYAREFLTPLEYELCLEDAERQYFLFLGKSVLKHKPAAFWEFHRQGLGVIGYKLDSSLYTKSVSYTHLSCRAALNFDRIDQGLPHAREYGVLRCGCSEYPVIDGVCIIMKGGIGAFEHTEGHVDYKGYSIRCV